MGKSTLFKTVTKKQVDCFNYAFCTIDPNVGVVSVLDERVEKLSQIFNPKKKIYSTIEFIDIAGLVEGASKGEGLGNRFLSHVREVDVVVYILRLFQNENILSVRDEINPLKEKELLDAELILKDMETVEKRINSLEKEVKAKNKEAVLHLKIFEKAKEVLDLGKVLIKSDLNKEEKEVLSSCGLLTIKQRLCVLNGHEKELTEEISSGFEKDGDPFIVMDIVEEYESAELTKEERGMLGFPQEAKIDDLIKRCYQLLGLITFFTVGSDEVRAWKTRRGSTAPQASGVIHSDFEKNFIKADVINWETLVNEGGLSEAKGKGLIRLEGKEYVVQDGDVLEIKHG